MGGEEVKQPTKETFLKNVKDQKKQILNNAIKFFTEEIHLFLEVEKPTP